MFYTFGYIHGRKKVIQYTNFIRIHIKYCICDYCLFIKIMNVFYSQVGTNYAKKQPGEMNCTSALCCLKPVSIHFQSQIDLNHANNSFFLLSCGASFHPNRHGSHLVFKSCLFYTHPSCQSRLLMRLH